MEKVESKAPLKAEYEKYRPILERREEIREEINKLTREYQALEAILKENIYLKETQKKKYREKREEREREESRHLDGRREMGEGRRRDKEDKVQFRGE